MASILYVNTDNHTTLVAMVALAQPKVKNHTNARAQSAAPRCSRLTSTTGTPLAGRRRHQHTVGIPRTWFFLCSPRLGLLRRHRRAAAINITLSLLPFLPAERNRLCAICLARSAVLRWLLLAIRALVTLPGPCSGFGPTPFLITP